MRNAKEAALLLLLRSCCDAAGKNAGGNWNAVVVDDEPATNKSAPRAEDVNLMAGLLLLSTVR